MIYILGTVDFEKILQQARMQDSSFGKTLRMIEHTWGKRPSPETRVQVIEVRYGMMLPINEIHSSNDLANSVTLQITEIHSWL